MFITIIVTMKNKKKEKRYSTWKQFIFYILFFFNFWFRILTSAREFPTPSILDRRFSSVQSLSHVRLFVTLWTATCQASLSITNSQSLLKLMSIEMVTPSNHLIFHRPLLLLPPIPPSIRVFSNECLRSFPTPEFFPVTQLFPSGGQNIGVSASTSVLPMNTQDWSPLGWTGWISLQSKRLSRIFSNTTVQKHQFFSVQLSLESNSHIQTWPLEKT